ncbi:hypothetical protein HYV85_05085 [Candidatus Woesearchaeota archaeon]|nr:hypothetical protein [Candidatus Woesearchaeota archaeon]
MTFVNAVEENRKYPDLDRGINTDTAIAVKALKRTYNLIMWFFVRDSWMALLPRWCGTIIIVLVILQLTGIVK